MDKSKIIKLLVRQEGKKEAFSLKMTKVLKKELQKIIATEHGISMNGLINAVLLSFVDNECGKKVATLESIAQDTLTSIDIQIRHLEEIGIDSDNHFEHETLLLKKKEIEAVL